MGDKKGTYTFTSINPDGHGGLYNPQNALAMTDEQKRRSASMYFDGVRKFDVTFAAYGGSTDKPRSFMFAGKSAQNFDPDGCPLLQRPPLDAEQLGQPRHRPRRRGNPVF